LVGLLTETIGLLVRSHYLTTIQDYFRRIYLLILWSEVMVDTDAFHGSEEFCMLYA